MKILLSRIKVFDDGGIPIASVNSTNGIALPDNSVIQYEQIRAAYIATRDNLIDAYRKAGGTY
jgi:hypothetical protein